MGRLISVTDPTTHVVEYEYDRAGRRTATIVDPGSGNLNLTTLFTYDNAGRLIQTTDPSGVKTVNVYDRAGRLTSTTLDPADPNTTPTELDITTSYAYNASGDLTSVTDALGRTASYTHDHAGRVTAVTAPGSRVTGTDFDRSGRVTETVSDDGVVTRTAYDWVGRATSVTVEPEDPGTQGAELNLVTEFEYDKAGRRTLVTNPRGFSTQYAFDDAGRLTGITDAATPTAGVVSFVHDNASRVTRVTNARGYHSDFEYDEMGRPIVLEDQLDRVHTRAYNGLGQLTELEDANGNDLRYAYDGANRLVEIEPAAGGIVYASFTYDANGRQTAATNYNGNLTYQFDAAGRVTQVGSPQGTVAYQYDKLHRRTGMTQTPTGGPARTTAYGYETPSGDLLTITDWNSRATTFQSTDDGLLSSIDRANDVDSLFNYDSAGRLNAISHFAPDDTALAEYAYTLDANGNRTQVVITGSAVANGTETYTLDRLDRLTNATYPGGGSASYAYDANGNRTQVVSGTTTTNYEHDAADQLDKLRDVNNVVIRDLNYDPNGNRTEDIAGSVTDTFTHDWANRLTDATVASTLTEIEYLADGARMTKESGSTTVPYLYDRAAGHARVVDDGSTAYVHGPQGLLEEVGGSTTWALGDGLGSVRARANGSGGVVGTADWDVFGNVRASSGSGGSFGWAGEQFDTQTGLTYLRARYYAPEVGRFVTPDILAQSGPGTQGFNRYAYAGNNPTTFVDPSGHAGLRDVADAVGRVFEEIARILECYAWGSCSFAGEHGGGGGGGGPSESSTWSAGLLAASPWLHPFPHRFQETVVDGSPNPHITEGPSTSRARKQIGGGDPVRTECFGFVLARRSGDNIEAQSFWECFGIAVTEMVSEKHIFRCNWGWGFFCGDMKSEGWMGDLCARNSAGVLWCPENGVDTKPATDRHRHMVVVDSSVTDDEGKHHTEGSSDIIS